MSMCLQVCLSQIDLLFHAISILCSEIKGVVNTMHIRRCLHDCLQVFDDFETLAQTGLQL